jgi:predicted enzyme related to lactoylglutathione lyase
MGTLYQGEITIFVQNLERSIRFYEKLFEIKITNSYKERWAVVERTSLFLLI